MCHCNGYIWHYWYKKTAIGNVSYTELMLFYDGVIIALIGKKYCESHWPPLSVDVRWRQHLRCTLVSEVGWWHQSSLTDDRGRWTDTRWMTIEAASHMQWSLACPALHWDNVVGVVINGWCVDVPHHRSANGCIPLWAGAATQGSTLSHDGAA